MSSSREVFRRRLDQKDPRRHRKDTHAEDHLNATSTELAGKHRPMAIFAFDHIGHAINVHGTYEKDELETLFAWLHQAAPSLFTGTAFDIGANIGNHALFFADHFRDVIAFEPNPRVFALLRLNAELAPNISCRDYGLSVQEQELGFRINPSNIGASHIVSHVDEATTTIHLRPLDAEFAARRDITFMKVDVEGHEFEALSGARQVIASNQPVIFFEQQESEIENGTSATIELLRSLGYRTFAMMVRETDRRRFKTRLARNLYRIYFNTVRGWREKIQYAIVLTDHFDKRFHPGVIALPDHLGIR
ncbi:FkbM family methyltransferase [Xanthobacter autotrophicus]|uniref:FkbM family methyltransferase n=1 Tax=Xanthobacter autotrophicus TaxID=280 RepID=UPI00372BEEAE